MLRDKLLIFWYKFHFISLIYYFFTIKTSMHMKKSIVKVYQNFIDIKNSLGEGKYYISDKIFDLKSEFMVHPGVVQYRLDTKQGIGDCDEHAIYWCTAIKKSKLAKKVWFAYFSFKRKNLNNDTYTYGAHAVCVFRDYDNKLYWCDYGMPREIKNIADFQTDYCNLKKSTPIVGCLWTVTAIDVHDTPIFGARARVLPGELVRL